MDKIDNTALVAQFRAAGGRIMHFRPNPNIPHARGITVAYVSKNSRVELATAVQHRADSFTKKIGTKTAIEHFLAGKTIVLPVRDNRPHNLISRLQYWLY